MRRIAPELRAARRAKWWWCGMVLTVTAISTANAQHEPAGEPADANGPPRGWREGHYVLGIVPDMDASYTVLHTPPIITNREIEQYAAMLRLSDAQQREFQRHYDTYVDRDWKHRVEVVMPLWARAADINTRFGGTSATPEAAQLYLQICRERDKAIEQIISMEQGFFAGFSKFLAEEQLPQLDRVKAYRDRMRTHNAFMSTSLRGGSFDLTCMLQKLENEDRLDLTPRDPEYFADILRNYDLEITPPILEIYEFNLKLVYENEPRHVEREQLAPAVRSGEVAAATARYRQLDEEMEPALLHLARLKKRIHEVNERYVHRAAAEFSQDAATELIARYRAITYPDVYPDPHDVAEMFDLLAEIEVLTAEQRADLDDLQAWYLSVRDGINDRMKRRYLDWVQYRLETGGYKHVHLDTYREEMQEIERGRLAHGLTALTLLEEFVRGTPAENSAPSFDRWRERMKLKTNAEAIEWPKP